MAKKTKRPSARGRASGGQRPRPTAIPARPTTAPRQFSDAAALQDTAALDTGERPDDLQAAASVPADQATSTDDTVPLSTTRQGALVRRGVQRVQPNAQRSAARRQLKAGSQAAIFEPLPPEDPAIPLDRVPYFLADFRRVLITAALMVGIIIVAAVFVSVAVK